ncbi:hypothetical protein [Chryseolinea lacunae]|nr:hypothetical protein [Chryseolinea lacunae]
MMIEVFKTNVHDRSVANMLIDRIHETFVEYRVTFDLEDCDKILRVKSFGGTVQCHEIIALLGAFGFHAEVLPMENKPADSIFSLYQ